MMLLFFGNPQPIAQSRMGVGHLTLVVVATDGIVDTYNVQKTTRQSLIWNGNYDGIGASSQDREMKIHSSALSLVSSSTILVQE